MIVKILLDEPDDFSALAEEVMGKINRSDNGGAVS